MLFSRASTRCAVDTPRYSPSTSSSELLLHFSVLLHNREPSRKISLLALGRARLFFLRLPGEPPGAEEQLGGWSYAFLLPGTLAVLPNLLWGNVSSGPRPGSVRSLPRKLVYGTSRPWRRGLLDWHVCASRRFQAPLAPGSRRRPLRRGQAATWLGRDSPEMYDRRFPPFADKRRHRPFFHHPSSSDELVRWIATCAVARRASPQPADR